MWDYICKNINVFILFLLHQHSHHHLECGLRGASWRHNRSAGVERGWWKHRHVYHRVRAFLTGSVNSQIFTSFFFYLIKLPGFCCSQTRACCWPCYSFPFFFLQSLQEVNSMINKRLKDALFTDQWSELCMERLSPFGYVLVSDVFFQTNA